MRFQWILSVFSILISMGLLVVIAGQYQELFKWAEQSARLQKQLKKLDDRVTNEYYFKASLEKMLARAKTSLTEMEPAVTQLGPELEKRRTERDACQSDTCNTERTIFFATQKTKKDELAEKEKALTDTEATLKSESDAWNQEIVTLKAQLTGISPICDHVKTSSRTQAEKLCDFSTTMATTPLTTI
ncbi:hypothetical protein F2P81_023358 [Scophthalmus maximus]|uniref:Uncharacterized protein n=1 Tax=Scophthalmus maximus TaxID=52904 RepID=A0A6A4RPP1_SCOMX|nr:hypothetical protein F2P81_023358 [Scophthalmus maximus]